MDVEIPDANLIDAASSGTTVGWQLAINVAAMLVSFVALVAMANLAVSWFGGFFRSGAGLVLFDLMAVAALASLLFVEKKGPTTDGTVWMILAGILAVVLALKLLGLGEWPRAVTVVGMAAWVPLFLLSGREKGYGRWGWGTVGAVALVANLAYVLFGPLAPEMDLSLQVVLGWLHWPVAFIMGVPAQDCLLVGKLLGEKLVLTEFAAYADLGNLLAASARGEIPPIDPRSTVIVSYALCGFANVASIGIQIGGIAPLAPSRRADIARLGFKAMVGGALATFMIACVAGTFYHGASTLGVSLAR
jgi:concentrative nucleoside transporter, CNT family